MNLDQIRKSLIIAAVVTMFSGVGFAYSLSAVKNNPSEIASEDVEKVADTSLDEDVNEADVLGESTDQNFFLYKPIFERALTSIVDKKTVEFYETKINDPKIRYFYKTDYRNKRFYKYADYNIEDFKTIEEMEKKLDVVKEVYMDGVFYIADTKGLSTVNESEQKKFENSTIHLNDLKESYFKYLELFEKENGTVSVLELDKSEGDEVQKTRYGFQSQTLGDSSMIIDKNFDIWEMSIEFRGVYTTFVFEAYNNDLNIVALEEGVDLNLLVPSPSPSVTPEPSPIDDLNEGSDPETVVSPQPSPTKVDVLDATDSKNVPNANMTFKLSDTCSKLKGSCYLEYTINGKLEQTYISKCDTDCDTRKTILSLNNANSQYIVEGYKNTSGYTKIYVFDKVSKTIQIQSQLNQNLFEIFDPTKVDTEVDPILANYTNGCFNPTTAGLYCIGNLNRMSESDIEKIETYLRNASDIFKTYIEAYI